jgi:hypothetical protein
MYVIIYLCCSLVGRCSASWGNPHWQKKIAIGGKKEHERLREVFKIMEKKELKISQPLVNNFLLKQLLIGSSRNSFRYFFCLHQPADNSQPHYDYLVTF